jgi:hypothetical protein
VYLAAGIVFTIPVLYRAYHFQHSKNKHYNKQDYSNYEDPAWLFIFFVQKSLSEPGSLPQDLTEELLDSEKIFQQITSGSLK